MWGVAHGRDAHATKNVPSHFPENSPICLSRSGSLMFYGVRWSDGWLSLRHLITLGTEILTIAIGFAVYRMLQHKGGENIEDA
jgi:hypothetical protein